MPFPLFLALKYLKPKRSFTSVVTVISVLGVILGVAIVIIVRAVMTGFGDMWREKILAFKPHVTISAYEGVIRDDETLAVEVLKAVGPGGDFLGQRHTRKHLRAEQWRGKILNRASYDRWAEDGALDATEKARWRALDLLETHEVDPLPTGLAERLDAVVPAP